MMPTDRGRPLSILRAMVDALDHDVLRLLARRMEIVGEIAVRKREHGLGIRDADRERTLLDDRLRVARELGLPAEDVESLFHLLLRASRDHQSALTPDT